MTEQCKATRVRKLPVLRVSHKRLHMKRVSRRLGLQVASSHAWTGECQDMEVEQALMKGRKTSGLQGPESGSRGRELMYG